MISKVVMKKLRKLKIPFKVGKETNYKTDKLPITLEYQDDIDIEEFRELPTYKRMCVCIMKNDHLCKFMGFSLTKTEMQMRTEAEIKYARLTDEKEK